MDHKYYGGSRLKLLIGRKAEQIAGAWEDWLIEALESYPEFVPPISFEKIKALADRVIDRGVKMGEGWLLPGEAAELIEKGYTNIIWRAAVRVSSQPHRRQGHNPASARALPQGKHLPRRL